MQGTHSKTGQKDLWALLYKGHMTLLIPPSPEASQRVLKEFDTYVTPTLGFRYFWHQRHDQPRAAPGGIACRHCKPSKKAGTAEISQMIRKESCLAAAAVCAAGTKRFGGLKDGLDRSGRSCGQVGRRGCSETRLLRDRETHGFESSGGYRRAMSGRRV